MPWELVAAVATHLFYSYVYFLRMERIQVLLDPEEKERFRRLAQEKGVSLSAWLREAALKRSAEETRSSRLRTTDALRAFFAQCDLREAGREPDWEEHLEVMDTSKLDGIV